MAVAAEQGAAPRAAERQFRRVPVGARTWISICVAILAYEAWISIAMLVWDQRALSRMTTEMMLTQYATRFGLYLVILVVLLTISALRPRWIGLLAAVFLVGAMAAAYVRWLQGSHIVTRILLPLQFTIFGLVIAGAAVAAHVRRSAGASVVAVTGLLLVVLPSFALRMATLVLSYRDISLVDLIVELIAPIGLFLASSAIPAVLAFGLLALYVPARLRRRERLQSAGVGGRSLPVFKFRIDDSALAAEARKLDEYALLWASIWPEHTLPARNAIAAELARRGYTREALESWSPGRRDLTIPASIEEPVSAECYRALCDAKRRWFIAYLIVGVVLLLLVAGVWLLAELSVPADARYFRIAALTIAAMVSITIGLRFRKRALRILLLRPFGEKRMTQSLREFVCANVGASGYVFTLSDRDYQPSVWLRVFAELPIGAFAFLAMFVITPFIRNSHRIATVKSERSFRGLQRMLLSQLRLSVYSFLAGEQAFNIRSTDEWWQMCIRMLMQTCDAIVVDLSKVKAGTEWELGQLRSRPLREKSIFVAGDASRESVERSLGMYFDREHLPRVFLYGEDGRFDSPAAAAFADRLRQLLESGLAAAAGAGEATHAPSRTRA